MNIARSVTAIVLLALLALAASAQEKDKYGAVKQVRVERAHRGRYGILVAAMKKWTRSKQSGRANLRLPGAAGVYAHVSKPVWRRIDGTVEVKAARRARL